jgi:hypothetical protein
MYNPVFSFERKRYSPLGQKIEHSIKIGDAALISLDTPFSNKMIIRVLFPIFCRYLVDEASYTLLHI